MRTLRVLYRLSLLLFAMLTGNLQRSIDYATHLNTERVEIDLARPSGQQ